MSATETESNEGVVTLALARGKVNALDGALVAELRGRLAALEADPSARAVVLTGRGSFFSFGFDVPKLYPLSREAFADYLESFTGLYTYLFTFPKPVVAALNGHAVAGGCMRALACDRRVMAAGRAKISLNEIGFGSSVLAGSVEMLRFRVGSAAATEVLYSGAMYIAEEARDLGLVEEVAPEDAVLERARRTAADLGSRPAAAFAGIKSLLRGPIAEEMRRREPASIRDFVEIWYSPATRAMLREIRIR